MDITNRINKCAKELGVSQTEISRKTGLTKGAVNQWFKGSTKPNGENLLILAKVLKVTPDYLISGYHSKKQLDISNLISVATPTFLPELERLQQASDKGILDDADKKMIAIIADKYKDRLK